MHVITEASPVIPEAPENLISVRVTVQSVILNWDDKSNNEDCFYLERSTNGTDFISLASPVANSVSYTNTGLSAETDYWYRIASHNTAGTSSYSGVLHVKTSKMGDGDAEENAISIFAGSYTTYSTTGFNNDYASSPAGTSSAPDILFKSYVPAGRKITITVTPGATTIDTVLGLLSQPEDPAVSDWLDYADDFIDGQAETVTYTNSSSVGMNIYIVVDGYSTSDYGAFTLKCDILP